MDARVSEYIAEKGILASTRVVEGIVGWCREWLADVESGEEIATLSDYFVVRYCDRVIDGGLAFVADDVKRVLSDCD